MGKGKKLKKGEVLSMYSSVFEHKYKDEGINKMIRVLKNTKKNRLFFKMFGKIMVQSIKERGVIKMKEMVFIDMDVFKSLMEQKEFLENEMKEKLEYKKEAGA